jgi:hypothetical protein
VWAQHDETAYPGRENGVFIVSTPETLDRLALPLGGTRQERAAATTQAGIFALDVALSIIEAPTNDAVAAKRLQFVAERCNDLTEQLAANAG